MVLILPFALYALTLIPTTWTWATDYYDDLSARDYAAADAQLDARNDLPLTARLSTRDYRVDDLSVRDSIHTAVIDALVSRGLVSPEEAASDLAVRSTDRAGYGPPGVVTVTVHWGGKEETMQVPSDLSLLEFGMGLVKKQVFNGLVADDTLEFREKPEGQILPINGKLSGFRFMRIGGSGNIYVNNRPSPKAETTTGVGAGGSQGGSTAGPRHGKKMGSKAGARRRQ